MNIGRWVFDSIQDSSKMLEVNTWHPVFLSTRLEAHGRASWKTNDIGIARVAFCIDSVRALVRRAEIALTKGGEALNVGENGTYVYRMELENSDVTNSLLSLEVPLYYIYVDSCPRCTYGQKLSIDRAVRMRDFSKIGATTSY